MRGNYLYRAVFSIISGKLAFINKNPAKKTIKLCRTKNEWTRSANVPCAPNDSR